MHGRIPVRLPRSDPGLAQCQGRITTRQRLRSEHPQPRRLQPRHGALQKNAVEETAPAKHCAGDTAHPGHLDRLGDQGIGQCAMKTRCGLVHRGHRRRLHTSPGFEQGEQIDLTCVLHAPISRLGLKRQNPSMAL